MSSLCPTAYLSTTCHRKCNKHTRSLWTLAVPGARPFLAPRADMSNGMKRLVRCQNCQKNGNIMWAGMTGTASVHLVILEAELFHFLDQGGTIHMQQVCRFALDPAGFHKGLHEELFFKRFDHGVKVDAVVWDVDAGDTPGDTGVGDFIGEVFRHNHAAPLQDGNTFHHIFEFAHITGPVIAL